MSSTALAIGKAGQRTKSYPLHEEIFTPVIFFQSLPWYGKILDVREKVQTVEKMEEYSIAMKKGIYVLFISMVLSAALAVLPHRGQAALGEFVDSVESDRKAFSAARGAITAHNEYTVHQVDSDSTIVREYVSASGLVFAVAWNGLVHPDLTQLLGSYAGEYERGLEQTPREPGRRRLQVKTNQVVVEEWGHMRNLQGRAYVPSLVPSGVSVDEIK